MGRGTSTGQTAVDPRRRRLDPTAGDHLDPNSILFGNGYARRAVAVHDPEADALMELREIGVEILEWRKALEDDELTAVQVLALIAAGVRDAEDAVKWIRGARVESPAQVQALRAVGVFNGHEAAQWIRRGRLSKPDQIFDYVDAGVENGRDLLDWGIAKREAQDGSAGFLQPVKVNPLVPEASEIRELRARGIKSGWDARLRVSSGDNVFA